MKESKWKKYWLKWAGKSKFVYGITLFLLVVYCVFRRVFLDCSAHMRKRIAVVLVICLLLAASGVYNNFAYMDADADIQETVLELVSEEREISVEEGYDKSPVCLLVLKNVGEISLNGLKVQTDPEKDFFVKMPEDWTDVLDAGEEIQVQVGLEKEKKKGRYEVEIYVTADELEEPVKEEIVFEVKQPESTNTPDPTATATPEPTVTPTPVVTAVPSQSVAPMVTEEPPVATEPVVSATPEPVVTPLISPTPSVVSSAVPESTPTVGHESVKLMLEEKTGVMTEGNMCFGNAELSLKFRIDAGTVRKGERLYYGTAGKYNFVDVKNGVAQVRLQGPMADWVQFYCQDDRGQKSDSMKLFVVLEADVPQIEMKQQMTETGQTKLSVVLKETGTVKSGIVDVMCYCDQQEMLPEEKTGTEKIEKPGQMYDAVVERSFSLPVGEDDKEHNYRVHVKDRAGNVIEKTMNIKRTEDESDDIIAVTLPTSFKIHMNPYSEGNSQIYTDDIPIVNHSDFDLDVKISSVQVDVNQDNAGGEVKTCDIDMQIRENTGGIRLIPQPEQIEAEGSQTAFVLPANTDYGEGVKRSVIDFMPNGVSRQVLPVTSVATPNTAYIRFFGTVTPGTEHLWRDGDLNVTVVFDFEKHLGVS